MSTLGAIVDDINLIYCVIKEKKMKKVVKLNEFMSACIQLLEESDKIIHKLRRSGMEVMTKNNDVKNVFTEADVQIQNTIEYNLRQLFPRAKIIGEEDQHPEIQWKPYIMPDQIEMNIVPQKLLLENFYTN